MGNITLELDSNFVAPSSRVRDEQQTKKMRVFDREQKFDENDTHTHTKVIRHHHHHGRPKRGTWPSTKKKKELHIPVNMAEDREDDTPFPFRRL